MCGIVVTLPVYDAASPGTPLDLAGLLPDAPGLDGGPDAHGVPAPELLDRLDRALACAADRVRTPEAVHRLGDPATDGTTLRARLARLVEWAGRAESALDAADGVAPSAVEEVQAALRRIRDRLWTIDCDGIGLAEAAWRLGPGAWTERSAISYAAVATALDVVDRLEVRGRDSAGLSVWVELDPADRAPEVARDDPLLRSGSVVPTATGLCFVYKRAAVVGSLGDNTAAIRAAIHADRLLHDVLSLPSAQVTVLAHTRWASVGRTSESNAHPVDNARPDGDGRDGPVSIAVLNGDVDNHLALLEEMGCAPDPAGVTTDAKVIPLLVSTALARGRTEQQAVTEMLASCSGSMAVATQTEVSRGEVHLAVKGSGQSLYVGFTPSGYLVASEVYGLVGQTQRFARVDGSPPGGTVLRLRRNGAGRPEGVERWNGSGTALPPIGEPQVSEVSSRDLALGDHEHFLDKELHDAPGSFRRTLRGRISLTGPRPAVALPEASLPGQIRGRIAGGDITSVVLVGQGTAAVAAQGIAHVVGSAVGTRLAVTALPATEFSAWHLRPDMSDTCLVAVSQSGSTTDTNRAVDLARERGCAVIAIVNRRDSDLAHKSDGVVYTSDGRDVELSVASTKAFYAQVAAGSLLGIELGRLVGGLAAGVEMALVDALTALPGQLTALLDDAGTVRPIAEAVAARYPNWSVVGSGPNRVAAQEIRIKLSELCYKAVAVDAVEDKKHIDLSAESLVVVCAAGAGPDQIADLVKEVEILRAHVNRPVVICDADTVDLWPGDLTIPVPSADPAFAWLLCTAAGHLLGYHMAKAIDATGDPLRRALEELERLVDAGAELGATLPPSVAEHVDRLLARAAAGELRGVLSSSGVLALSALVAPRPVVSPARSAAGLDLVAAARLALVTAIEELTRSIDTIKHQAKTVTVGTSRGDADLADNVLVHALRNAGVDVPGLGPAVLGTLRSFAGVVDRATGLTRYGIDRDAPVDGQLRVLRKEGVAADLPSRADAGGPLAGHKRLAVEQQLPALVRGRRDGRTVVLVPEPVDGVVRALTLVHVELRSSAPAHRVRRAVEAAGRVDQIVAAVTELSPGFPLAAVWEAPPAVLLLDPVESVLEALGQA